MIKYESSLDVNNRQASPQLSDLSDWTPYDRKDQFDW